MDAKQILNVPNLVYKKHKKKEKCSKQKADYANMTSLVTPRLFSTFKGEYPVFLSDIIFFLNFASKLRFK